MDLPDICFRAEVLLVAAVASIAPVPSALAQTSLPVIEEVIVTAQKRTQDLQRAPAAISVVPGELMRRMAVRNSTQLEETIPNLTVQSTRPYQSFPVIRGIGSPVEGMGVDPGVAVYVDGVQVDSQVANLFSVLDLERVEVLRGPQGTLYGRNAIGGVINLVSRRPGDELAADLRAGVGNYGFQEFGASVEGAIVPGAAGRMSVALTENTEGQFRNNAAQIIGQPVEDNGALESGTARGMLDYEHPSSLRIILSADYTETDTSGPAVQPLDDVNALAKASALDGLQVPIYVESDDDRFALAHNLESRNESRVYGAGLTVSYRLNERMDIVSITGYRENDAQSLEDLDGSPYRYLEVASDAAVKSLSQEVRLHYSDERLEGVTGLFYTDAKARNLFSVDAAAEFLVAAGGSEPAITWRGAESTSVALFSQWEWGLAEGIRLTLGGRWSHSEKSSFRQDYLFSDLAVSAENAGLERCFILGAGLGPQEQPDCLTRLRVPGQADLPLPPSIADAQLEGNWAQFSPKLSVSVDLGEDALAFASYSQGYRDGGLEGTAASFREFDEEILHAYEVGIKTDLASERLRVNASLFYYDYDDMQLELSRLSDNVVARSVFNAGDARAQGAELEMTWRVRRAWHLALNLGWLDTEITKFDRSDPTINPGFIMEGNELARSPEWTVSFVPTLEVPLAGGTLSWRSEFNYKSAFFRDVENGAFADQNDALILTAAGIYVGLPPSDAVVTTGTPLYNERFNSRLLVNSMLSYLSAGGRFEVTLWARNLLDEKYVTDGDFVNGLGFSRAVYGAPRSYGAQVGFSY